MRSLATLERMQDAVPFLRREYLGNTFQEWLIALFVLIAATLALGIAKRLVLYRLAKLAERTDTDLDDLIVDPVRRTKRWFLFVMAARLASQFLLLSDATHLYLSKIAIGALWIQVGLWGLGLVQFGLNRMVRGKAAEDPSRTMGASVLGLIGRALVWVVALLGGLQHEGVDVTALITGLGVGGIAVALALQNVLGDLFASITILLDKPFVVGDAIVLGDFTGTVEEIGIKTTRLRSVNGEQIVMGNADLVHSRIRNFKRLQERRALFTVGVIYQTPFEKLASIPAMLKEIVESVPNTRFDRAHFKSFGDWALVFEVVYFVPKPEYNVFMDAQQAINLAIHRRFERERIEIAYPTQTVHHVSSEGVEAHDQKELSRG